MEESKLTEHQKCQYIVNKFCKTPINWPKNYKIAKKLLSTVDFSIFWSMEIPKVAGLQFFLCPDGIERIEKEKNKKELILPPKQEYKVEDKKFGADYKVEQKQSILDFAN